MANRVMHFEIPSDHPAVNMKFYSSVFNWKFEQFGDQQYWYAISGDETTQGINGAVMKKIAPGQPLSNTISVANIDDSMKKIEAAGGKIIKPKWKIPSVGMLAFFSDPDGNCFGLLQEEEHSK